MARLVANELWGSTCPCHFSTGVIDTSPGFHRVLGVLNSDLNDFVAGILQTELSHPEEMSYLTTIEIFWVFISTFNIIISIFLKALTQTSRSCVWCSIRPGVGLQSLFSYSLPLSYVYILHCYEQYNNDAKDEIMVTEGHLGI